MCKEYLNFDIYRWTCIFSFVEIQNTEHCDKRDNLLYD